MKLFENHFHKSHLYVGLALWLVFTAWTFATAFQGIRDDSRQTRIVQTTCSVILGPMTGAISRGCQSCCLKASLDLMPYSGAFLVLGTLPLFLRLPRARATNVLRMTLWIIGLLGWFGGGMLSFFHAFS